MQNLASPSRSRLETGRRVQRWTVPGLYTWDLSPIFYFLSIHPCWLQGACTTGRGASSNGAPAASAPSSPIGQSCLWGGRGERKLQWIEEEREEGRELPTVGGPWCSLQLHKGREGEGGGGKERQGRFSLLLSTPRRPFDLDISPLLLQPPASKFFGEKEGGRVRTGLIWGEKEKDGNSRL